MTHDELEKLFRLGDTSNEAIRLRLIAARVSTGLGQKDVADAVGIAKQTYHSQEGRGAPSIATARYFYRAHGIDFNFLFHGDFVQLNPEVRERLAAAAQSEAG
ncbi:helix-turn-helix domain-containing protein [Pseudooceanicola sp. CBS1P-1]|uniref:XRE family transcriptional regulator n=1 Tax=Pseudooceanicola albus TaxID=2692189 RepID=A0A6L7G8N7_9RHOB|nr:MULTISPECIES: helix-turn-helix transcriptional regulator [Pseudooceanicola]MBT9384496.1 helix-turn-helix domain-containing protein [Pseudooceanicola endophyticus]MXN20604.1 XRE family transcriptional regulator [Pseudooceanicola albus]